MSRVGVHPLWLPPPPEDTRFTVRLDSVSQLLRHTNIYSAGLMAVKVSQERMKRKERGKKRCGGEELSCFPPDH